MNTLSISMPEFDLKPIKKFTQFATVITVLQMIIMEVGYENCIIVLALVLGALAGLLFSMAVLTPRTPAQRQVTLRQNTLVRGRNSVRGRGRHSKIASRRVPNR